jgi:hypothetical protein
MQANIFPGSIISTTIMWVSATQGETGFWPEHRKRVGDITVTFSGDCTVTTYNTEVILTDEIDKNYSGIPVSSER